MSENDYIWYDNNTVAAVWVYLSGFFAEDFKNNNIKSETILINVSKIEALHFLRVGEKVYAQISFNVSLKMKDFVIPLKSWVTISKSNKYLPELPEGLKSDEDFIKRFNLRDINSKSGESNDS